MSIKIDIPDDKSTSDIEEIRNLNTDVVYQNVKERTCFIYIDSNYGSHYVIVDGEFLSFGDWDAARDHVLENDLPDAWKPTKLTFVVSIK